MSSNRRGEQGSVPFRTNLFFCANYDWFFSTREDTNEGPYKSKTLAQAALTNFVRNRGFAHSEAIKKEERIESTENTNNHDPSEEHGFYW